MNLIEPIFDAEDFDGVDDEQLSESMLKYGEAFLATSRILDGLKIELLRAKVDGVIVSQYEAIVVSRFTLDDDVYLGTMDGHVVNVTKLINTLRETRNSFK